MEVAENSAGGTTVELQRDDWLDTVPASHAHLLTPALRAAFADPQSTFRGIADRTRYLSMAQWLRALLTEDRWALHLCQGEPSEWTFAGFVWESDKVQSALIGLPCNCDLSLYPTELRSYYELVGPIHWSVFGHAGGLDQPGSLLPITQFPYEFSGAPIEPSRTFVCGWSLYGDMLIFTSDGRGGWLCHETGHIHLIGSIAQMLEWVYAELLGNRCPIYDHKWARMEDEG
jgi:hypothetical protein